MDNENKIAIKEVLEFLKKDKNIENYNIKEQSIEIYTCSDDIEFWWFEIFVVLENYRRGI